MKKLFYLLVLLPSLCFAQVPDSQVSNGLIRHWTFDEALGGTATDTISGDVITWTGFTQGVAAKFGNGAQSTANSSNYGLNTIASFGLAGSTHCTISLWVYITNYQTSSHAPWFQDNVAAAIQSVGAIYYDNNPQWMWQVAGNNYTQYDGNPRITKNAWHNLMFKFKINDFVKTYYDGVWISSAPTNGNAIPTTSYVEKINYYNGQTGWGGIWDDVTAWNVDLDSATMYKVINNDWAVAGSGIEEDIIDSGEE